MLGWAVEANKIATNPVRDVRRVKYASEGFHTWSLAEVRQFQQHHAIGTKARLALELLLLTGARRGDVVTFGRQHVDNGFLRYVPRKTRYRRMDATFKRILPRLAEILDKSPTGELTFLVTSFGKPFTPAGFSNWFRERCDEAGLSHCSAHGLRKAGADHRRGERRHRAPADGDLRLEHTVAGEHLHSRGQPQEAGGTDHEAAGERIGVRTNVVAPYPFWSVAPKQNQWLRGVDGGSDGTRTRGLCRDRAAL